MSKKNIMFSVIVPVFNCENYINNCLNSISNQQKDIYELIIVDDGSTDNTKIICDEFKEKNKNWKIYHLNNNGVSSARNYGIEHSNGQYVIFLDADDFVDLGYFEKIMDIIKQDKNVELINFGFFSEVYDKKMKILSTDKIFYKEKKYLSHLEIKKDLVSLWDSSMLYNVWNKVYKKDILNQYNIRFSNIYFGEDMDFNMQYLLHVSNFYNSDNCFYHYIRERNGSVTKNYKKDIFNIRKKEFINLNFYFEKWNISKDEYYEFSCRRFIERVLGCIENIYCSNMNFKNKYNLVKNIINDSLTCETIKYVKPKSKKIKIMIIPIKYKLVMLTMLMGRFTNVIKIIAPGLFNTLKNNR